MPPLPPLATRRLLLAWCASAALPSQAGPLRERLVQRRAGRSGAGEVLQDVAYGSDPAQRLDVHLPAAGAGAAPVIFMVHGGGWRIGDKTHGRVVDRKVAHWVPRGIAFISTNYRMLPEADPIEQARDVGRAVAFAQAQAAGWGADPSRFVLMGHSAGAHLVSLLAADGGLARSLGMRPWLGTVALDSAAMDVVALMREPHPALYDVAFGQDAAFWRAASPVHQLQGRPSPMLMVCSTRRRDACPQAQALADRVAAAGGRARVLLQDLSHGEINGELGRPGSYTREVDAFLASVGLEGSLSHAATPAPATAPLAKQAVSR